MNTKTILNFKTEKTLKESAQKTAKMMGLPLGTVMNAFLKEFVREKEITFSAVSYKPSEFLMKTIRQAEDDFSKGDVIGPFDNVEDFMKSLKS